MGNVIKLLIDGEIEGEDRGQLWDVCCGSYPVINMTDDSDMDSGEWFLERAKDSGYEQYLNERETLRDCIYNLGYNIDGYDGGEWIVR